ncbi:hypothetical protein KV572_09430 [Pseudomonas yamanorum]|uniref:hypothetical protein n=1 Tax=Pseudomonas yamanorum TaxID=515393 RepID=UPI001C4861B2|nr:hypothetical protein [Pseudomonas yamanorum]MBV6661149.1 hypothetical protein [Pseudomonas yamanorum]
MASDNPLTDALERLYQNQVALKASVMEVTIWAKRRNAVELGENIQRTFQTIGENAGYIK